MLDSIFHITFKVIKSHYWRVNVKMLSVFTQRRHMIVELQLDKANVFNTEAIFWAWTRPCQRLEWNFKSCSRPPDKSA